MKHLSGLVAAAALAIPLAAEAVVPSAPSQDPALAAAAALVTAPLFAVPKVG